MRKPFMLVTILLISLMLVPAVMATNGTNLIGIGPISRAMGGGGVAAPQDAISAVFANPAAACFGPYCNGSTIDFAGTWFDPNVNESFVNNAGAPPPVPASGTGKSALNPFVVPAIAASTPINPKLRFGIGMYGQSGMGTDYKGTNMGTLYTQLQVMKFAPNLAWLVTPNFSVGSSLEIVWQNLDLGAGAAHDFALGLQLGALYHLGKFNFGASYTTPESIKHTKVADFDQNGTFDNLKLENPHTFKLGVSYEPSTSWLFEVYGRWYNWSDADGYKDFGWDDQLVYGIGAQWRPAEKWAIRVGYNYGENPVKLNNGFNAAPGATTNVQGVAVPNLSYEILRIVGFPAIVEHHFTGGVGYNITQDWILNLSFMYSPEETVTEASAGNAFILESDLEQWSSTFGLTWNF